MDCMKFCVNSFFPLKDTCSPNNIILSVDYTGALLLLAESTMLWLLLHTNHLKQWHNPNKHHCFLIHECKKISLFIWPDKGSTYLLSWCQQQHEEQFSVHVHITLNTFLSSTIFLKEQMICSCFHASYNVLLTSIIVLPPCGQNSQRQNVPSKRLQILLHSSTNNTVL